LSIEEELVEDDDEEEELVVEDELLFEEFELIELLHPNLFIGFL